MHLAFTNKRLHRSAASVIPADTLAAVLAECVLNVMKRRKNTFVLTESDGSQVGSESTVCSGET